ncbi:hypothetical protein E2C01_019356 [Portunus trituberculatus]|uniref:Secreted protein n=1 Tax=Portunus trituberculatus TaxID=210409 RepID=A0A5B7DWZ5_PORTR|nr:hypothetical protein [Portunus trituberculatus]
MLLSYLLHWAPPIATSYLYLVLFFNPSSGSTEAEVPDLVFRLCQLAGPMSSTEERCRNFGAVGWFHRPTLRTSPSGVEMGYRTRRSGHLRIRVPCQRILVGDAGDEKRALR